MLTLFIDTHYEEVIIIIYKDGHILDHFEGVSNYRHSEMVMPKLAEIIAKNSLNINDFKELIVVNGPGSFTGIRIGVTIAKTIAFCLNIPIKTISSLAIIACNLTGEKIVGLREKNGIFGATFDAENKMIGEPFYLNSDEELNFQGEIIEKVTIDYEKVYQECQKIVPTNAHQVNPIYIKKIGVLNDQIS